MWKGRRNVKCLPSLAWLLAQRNVPTSSCPLLCSTTSLIRDGRWYYVVCLERLTLLGFWNPDMGFHRRFPGILISHSHPSHTPPITVVTGVLPSLRRDLGSVLLHISICPGHGPWEVSATPPISDDANHCSRDCCLTFPDSRNPPD